MPLFSQHTARFSPDVPLEGTSSRELLKRFQPLETLATGGFGSIEICRDTHLRRRVAIKRIPLTSGAGMPASDIMDVLREAHTAAMLQHPNIVQVIDFTHDTAYAYLVMEYVDGMSLAEFLHRADGHSLTFDEAAAIADALGQALTFAHSNGVLHLDIKPANVLIDHSGNVKLTDFGMARLSSAGGFGGSRGGTIGYMPPEQLDIETGTVDERADVFALACVIYEGLCGSAPFMAATPGLARPHHRRRHLPSELIPHFPGSRAALAGALLPMPQDRPNSIEAFCDQLLAGLGSVREAVAAWSKWLASFRMTSRSSTISSRHYEDDAIEIDPALGWAGTRWSHARDYTMRAISALACGTFSFLLMQTAGVAALPGTGHCGYRNRAAAGLAPDRLGHLGCGLLVLMANATMQAQGILSMLPVAVIFAAAMSGWWIAGSHRGCRERRLTCALALGCLTGNTFLAAGVASGVASFLLGPASAAAATGMGALFARLATVALSAGGVLGLGNVAAALGDPLLWAAFGLAAATAAASSALLNAHAKRANQSSNLAAIAAIAVTGIGCAAASCLAHHMESASLAAAVIAKAAVAGILSSIIVGICLYLLGYQRTYTESDLS
ncbi:MAG: serine/threonine-protein kinase [Collinsella sp.]